jgi:hypothetical protein
MGSTHYCPKALTEEIRLLDLVSPCELVYIEGCIRRTTICDATPFVAVSHVWGDREPGPRMRLDSGCGSKDAQISPRLEALFIRLLAHDPTTLPQLWDNGSRLPLWVDMICINQSDVAEKALQIPLMREI